MIEDMRQHMRDDHGYDESDIAPTLRSSDAELWKLHAHYHGERLSTTEAQRALQGHESDSEYAARLLREHGVRGS